MRVCGGEEPTVSVLRGPMAQAGSASTSRIPQERGSLPQLERTEVVTDSCLSKGYLTYVLCGEAHFHAHGRCCQRECWRAWACPSTSSSHVLTAEIQTAPCRRLWAHDVVLNVEVPKGRWSISNKAILNSRFKIIPFNCIFCISGFWRKKEHLNL